MNIQTAQLGPIIITLLLVVAVVVAVAAVTILVHSLINNAFWTANICHFMRNYRLIIDGVFGRNDEIVEYFRQMR
jgi:hypothetical protein